MELKLGWIADIEADEYGTAAFVYKIWVWSTR